MTAPAVSLYQTEMAKRGLTLVKATGCPRKAISTHRPTTASAALLDRRERNELMARWYTEMPDWSLDDVAEHSLRVFGSRGVRTGATVQRILLEMGVKMRPTGRANAATLYDKRLKKLADENTQLRRDVQMLKARLAGLRRKTREGA